MKHVRPYRLTEPGWYALLCDPGSPTHPPLGPYRTEEEIQAAVARWYRHSRRMLDKHACNPEVLGPYPTRALARKARKEDDVRHQPLLPPSGSFMSLRADGAGHWPRGKPRHDPDPPEGWSCLGDFLDSLREYCDGHRGAARALSQHLGVSAMTVSRYLRRQSRPSQKTVNRMARWARDTLRDPIC